MNTQQVADRAKVTYRQLDTWVSKGWLKPSMIPGVGRGGLVSDWSSAETEIAVHMGALVRAGVYPEKAHKLARGDRSALTALLGAVAPCMGGGELLYRWFSAPRTPDDGGSRGN